MAVRRNIEFREFVQQVKDALRIDDVVRDYVPSLQRAGTAFKGLCPFHKEKTPSFHVHPEMGFYHCFGCGAHGDVIKFVQEIEKIDFRLALEQLARRLGMEMPAFSGQRPSEEEDRRLAQLRELCAWAMEFFIEQMRVDPRGGLARDYLRRRGLSDDEIRQYRLGYAPDGYETLLRAAERRGWKAETVAEAGLASRTDRGSFIDRFRDRVIFPITDRVGEVVAFAGRLIENRENAPKYINSAETPIFRKNQLLYGLSDAREGIRETGSAILLEGYMDWIAMHRHGLKNALAGMGTALTEEQARLLRRLTGKVVLLYDADTAGQKAMYRATEILLRQGLEVHAAVLSEGEDPDSFLARQGTQAMRDILSQPPPALDHFIQQSARDFDLTRPEGKARAVDWLAPLLLAIEEPALREGYLVRAARGIGLRLETLEESLQRRKRRTAVYAEPWEEGGAEVPFDVEGMPSQTEQNLLYIVLRNWDRWEWLQQINPDWFQHPILRDLFERMYTCQRDVREGADPPADIFALADDETIRHWISRILLLPVRKFGGEVGDFDQVLPEALEFQILKLKKQAARRIKQRISGDLQLIMNEKPLGDGHLARIHDLSRENLHEWDRYLNPRPPEN